ncbi:hypothetical protein GS440_24670 [Rhodococcus hoagii]|nr:hypothetical protein [Prescottella equi]
MGPGEFVKAAPVGGGDHGGGVVPDGTGGAAEGEDVAVGAVDGLGHAISACSSEFGTDADRVMWPTAGDGASRMAA